MTIASTMSSIVAGHSVTLVGTYYKAPTGGFEVFYPDGVMDNGVAAAAPPVTTAQLADIQRAGNTTKYWFQRVSVNLGTGSLKMFDFTPAEFKRSGVATCPIMFGWGMVPSTSSDTVGMACNATTQPVSPVTTAPPSDEVLVGTDFYRTYTYSNDCMCAATAMETLLTGANTLSGTIGGILIGDTPFGATTSYQYLAPLSNSDAMPQ
jgi:hypothetical protein